MTNRLIALIVFLGLLLPGHGFTQLDRSEEVSKLMAGLGSAGRVQRVNSAKVISRSGLQDQALYQKVANLLEAGYSQEYEMEHADEMSWMCKALAASGDSKYRELLDEVATKSPSIKVQRYAKESSKLIDTYAQRNRILNATDDWDDTLTSEENRLVNMLKSDDISLKRDAAKSIVRNIESNEKVFAAAASALSALSKGLYSDSVSVDTLSWLCKALAASGDKKYLEVLEHVYADTQSQKLRTYASRAIKALN